MSRRRAATLVETLLGAALFLAVMAGAWVVLTATRRQTEQAYRYTSVTQGAASIATRLRLDLAAVTLGGPPGPGNAAVQVGEDGRSLGLLRAPALGPTGGPMEVPSGSVWVEWSTAPGPGGTSLLVRTENAAALDPADRERYVDAVADVLVPGGALVAVLWEHGRDGGPPYDIAGDLISSWFARRFQEVGRIDLPPFERRPGVERLVTFTLAPEGGLPVA